jgi:hypothetical protein
MDDGEISDVDIDSCAQVFCIPCSLEREGSTLLHHLSPVIANFFMEDFEERALEKATQALLLVLLCR